MNVANPAVLPPSAFRARVLPKMKSLDVYSELLESGSVRDVRIMERIRERPNYFYNVTK